MWNISISPPSFPYPFNTSFSVAESLFISPLIFLYVLASLPSGFNFVFYIWPRHVAVAGPQLLMCQGPANGQILNELWYKNTSSTTVCKYRVLLKLLYQ